MNIHFVKKVTSVMAILASGTLLYGCATAGTANEAEIDTIEADQMHRLMETVPQQATASEGSLWRDGTAMLYVDSRARSVGDTIIVDIVESSSSKMAANTSANRSASVDASVDNALGYLRYLESKNSNLGADTTGTQGNSLPRASASASRGSLSQRTLVSLFTIA